jgi:hypothetical protein
LRRTSAGQRECVLRGRCRSQGERRDGVRMQRNTVASQDNQSIVLRLTRRTQSFGTRPDVELEFVAQIFTSWNPLTSWIRQIESYRSAA